MDKQAKLFFDLFFELFNNSELNQKKPFDYEFGRTHFYITYKKHKYRAKDIFDDIFFEWFVLNTLMMIKDELKSNEQYEFIVLCTFLINEIVFSLKRKKMFYLMDGEWHPHPFLCQFRIYT